MVACLKRTSNFILTMQRKYAAVCVTLRPNMEQVPALKGQKAEDAWEGHAEGRTKDFERENMMRFDLKIKQQTQTTTLSTSTQEQWEECSLSHPG